MIHVKFYGKGWNFVASMAMPVIPREGEFVNINDTLYEVDFIKYIFSVGVFVGVMIQFK
jgi:hypothetical protein